MAEPIVSLAVIQRGAAGHCPHALHHSAPRVRRAGRSPDSTTVLHVQRTRNSPASQRISSCDVRMNRAARPVSGSMFCDSAVRLLVWKGAGVAGRVKGVGRGVFMEMNCPFFCPDQRDMTAQMICLEVPR